MIAFLRVIGTELLLKRRLLWLPAIAKVISSIRCRQLSILLVSIWAIHSEPASAANDDGAAAGVIFLILIFLALFLIPTIVAYHVFFGGKPYHARSFVYDFIHSTAWTWHTKLPGPRENWSGWSRSLFGFIIENGDLSFAVDANKTHVPFVFDNPLWRNKARRTFVVNKYRH
jgi:hypothetical protein